MLTTVGEVRAFLGLAGYLRGFVPNFSDIAAPILDILRNKEFASKRARNRRVPWGAEQAATFGHTIEKLTTHPILVLPDWHQPFTLHTDVSTLAAGSALRQEVETREAPVGYASERFSLTEEKLSSSDREVLGVFYALDHFKIYLQHNKFTLVTDCGALMWLFMSQNLSSKIHRWALRMMAYDMVLQWRKETDHILPEALSRLRRKGPQEPDIDTGIPGGTVDETKQRGPGGPVLHGIPLQSIAPLMTEEEEPINTPPELAAWSGLPLAELILDGICLADMGATKIHNLGETNLATFFALRLTPDASEETDTEWLVAYQQVQSFFTPKKTESGCPRPRSRGNIPRGLWHAGCNLRTGRGLEDV